MKKYFTSIVNEVICSKTNPLIIGVGGKCKSGKSTIINAIMTYDMLPEDDAPETAALTMVLHDKNCVEPQLTKIFPKVMQGAEHSFLSLDNEDRIVLAKGCKEIKAMLNEINENNRKNKGIKFNEAEIPAYLIRCNIPCFNDEKICFIDTPGLGETDLKNCWLELNAILLKNVDLWIEVMSYIPTPTVEDTDLYIKSLIVNMKISGRNFKNTKILINKCDKPDAPGSKKAIELWKTKTPELIKDYETIDPANDLILISGLNLMRYSTLEYHNEFLEQDREELQEELNTLSQTDRNKICDIKKKNWLKGSNAEKFINWIKGCYKNWRNTKDNSVEKLKNIEKLVSELIVIIDKVPREKIKVEIVKLRDLYSSIVRPAVENFRSKLEKVQKDDQRTIEDIQYNCKMLSESAQVILSQCNIFMTAGYAFVSSPRYLEIHWKYALAKIKHLSNFFDQLKVVSKDSGFFATLFSVKGAMILVNATYGLRLLGYLSTTWWCVPIFGCLAVADTIVTVIFYMKSRNPAEPTKISDATTHWKNHIGVLSKEFSNLENDLIDPSNDIIPFTGLDDENKKIKKKELNELLIKMGNNS